MQNLKLVHYPDDCHPKNKESMIRMCQKHGIQYEATNNRHRLNVPDYDFLWLPMSWISPDELPKSIKILYGPHHFIFPEGPIVGSPNEDWGKRCFYFCLSDWVEDLYKEFVSESVIPFKPFSFGVDSNIEDLKKYPKSLDCLVYFKGRDPNELKFVEKTLKEMNISYKIISYGSYKNHEYMELLKQVKFVIWLGRHESQGFALQECLAANVPILVWDVTSMFQEHNVYNNYRGHKNLCATATSLWSSLCGEKIIHSFELRQAIENITTNIDFYRPRDFILSKVDDKLCTERILNYFGI